MLSTQTKSYLPQSYTPAKTDVICARGLESFQHPGNIKYREVIQEHLNRYNNSVTKVEKSMVVLEIIEQIRSSSTVSLESSKFVRFDNKSGLWYEIGDAAARQKVGQTIREMNTNKDPKKKAKQALKRAQSRARRSEDPTISTSSPVKRKKTTSSSPSSSVLCPCKPVRSQSAPIPAALPELPVCLEKPVRSQSVPIPQLEPRLPKPLATRKRAVSQSVSNYSLVEAYMSVPPPPLEAATSRLWFRNDFLPVEDSELPYDIDSLFDDGEVTQTVSI